MNVIVAGASGFIGRNFLIKAPKSWNITALFNKDPYFLEFVGEEGLQNVSPHRCDLTNAESVKDLISRLNKRFDVCLYLAANGNPSLSVKNPRADLEKTTITLINFLDHFRAEKLIYFSSGAVYEGLRGLVFPEASVLPKLPYAISHLASEQYVKFFASQGKISNYIILRFFGAYGPYEPPRKIYTKLIENFYLRNRNQFTVRGDGENYIDAMYVDDAIKGTLNVINSDLTNLTVDFCKGEQLTVNELVKKAAVIFNKKDAVIEHLDHVVEHNDFYASPAKMGELFGFEPRIDLEDGLSRFARFLENRVRVKP